MQEPTRKRRSRKTGLPPGSLVPVGQVRTTKPEISIFHYDEVTLEEKAIQDVSELVAYKEKPGVFWIDIDGVHDPSMIEKIGQIFELHALTLEDILNTEQRPKKEDFGNYIYVVLRMLHHSKDRHQIISEQVSLILGENFLISFQEQERAGDVFDYVRDRLRKNSSRLRRSRSDYLAYALIDAVVDYYFVILEQQGEELEKLERLVVENPEPTVLPVLYALKRRMLELRRSIWPLREVINGLVRDETNLVSKSTTLFLRDVYDHSVQVVDTIENYREMLSSMLDIYLSSVSNRMNTVMKFLTLFATIFMPLTFIVGVYGMNFEYMPELKWRLGYPLVWVVMIIVTLVILVFFRKKRWM